MSEATFTIRRAEKDDAPALFDLLRELALFERLIPPDKEARERLLEDGWGENKRFDAYLAWVPESETPVGFCVVFETYSTFLARPRLFIEDLYVCPDFRRHGIGSALIKWCLELAYERGCWRVECMGLDWNASAQDLYEKMGAHQFFEWFLFRFERRMIEHHLGLGPKRRFDQIIESPPNKKRHFNGAALWFPLRRLRLGFSIDCPAPSFRGEPCDPKNRSLWPLTEGSAQNFRYRQTAVDSSVARLPSE